MKLDYLTKILFPIKCINCGNYGNRLCDKCRSTLESLDFPLCLVCENLSLGGKTHKICLQKYKNVMPESFNCKYIYNQPVKKLLLKSKSGPGAYKYLDLLIDPGQIEEIAELKIDYIIPMPASRKKLMDQSHYLCNKISTILKTPVLKALVRARLSQQQKSLSRENRFLKSQNKYKVANETENKLRGKTVLLVDDICTTGATLIFGSRKLLEIGVKTVHCYTFILRQQEKSHLFK